MNKILISVNYFCYFCKRFQIEFTDLEDLMYVLGYPPAILPDFANLSSRLYQGTTALKITKEISKYFILVVIRKDSLFKHNAATFTAMLFRKEG